MTTIKKTAAEIYEICETVGTKFVTVKELRALAREAGISGRSTMRKAYLLVALNITAPALQDFSKRFAAGIKFVTMKELRALEYEVFGSIKRGERKEFLYGTLCQCVKFQAEKAEKENTPVTIDASECTEDKFMAAYDALNVNNKIWVNISNLRKELQWDRDIFDTILKSLRNKLVIELCSGDVSTMSAEDVKNNSFYDENGLRFLTIKRVRL